MQLKIMVARQLCRSKNTSEKPHSQDKFDMQQLHPIYSKIIQMVTGRGFLQQIAIYRNSSKT